MSNLILALDLEGVLITNAISQFPRPGLRQFLTQCEEMFGHENICNLQKYLRDGLGKLHPHWLIRITHPDGLKTYGMTG